MYVNVNTSVSSLTTTAAVSSLSSPSASGTSDTSEASGVAASADMSKPAELLNKLKQLKQQDPTKFKQVMSDIADELRTAAKNSGAAGGAMLSKLADKFEQAGQTGDLSTLQPPPRPAAGSPQSAPAKYQANSGSTADAALQEALETPDQTAKEAATGDTQAVRLLAKESAAKEARAHQGGGTMHGVVSKILDEVNQALGSNAVSTTASSASAT